MPKGSSTYARIYDVVGRIPPGRVATYGQIAKLAGRPGHARQVGYALSALPEDSDVPWHRVINAKGEISPRSFPDENGEQEVRLKAEGVVFDERGRVALSQSGWPEGR
jgi:methylated-DNA-protein-cysteine methyltransferase-like protein